MKRLRPYAGKEMARFHHGISVSLDIAKREVVRGQRKSLTLREIAERAGFPLSTIHVAAMRLLK